MVKEKEKTEKEKTDLYLKVGKELFTVLVKYSEDLTMFEQFDILGSLYSAVVMNQLNQLKDKNAKEEKAKKWS